MNPANTAISANTSIPYYNFYVTDTWHARPSFTVSYGLGYAIELPPSERDGNQVMFTDASGNAIHILDFLNSRKTAAMQGQIFNPQIGFALLKNVVGSPKYPYNPTMVRSARAFRLPGTRSSMAACWARSSAMDLRCSAQATDASTDASMATCYGRRGFDQRIIFNTFVVYETPWYRNQSGIVGRLAGGWTISPVVAAGTGQPLTCTTNNAGQNFGGNDGSTLTDNENCIFLSNPDSGHTTRGIMGGTVTANGSAISVGTNPKGPGSAAVNMFADPASVYSNVRPPILGVDQRDGALARSAG